MFNEDPLSSHPHSGEVSHNPSWWTDSRASFLVSCWMVREESSVNPWYFPMISNNFYRTPADDPVNFTLRTESEAPFFSDKFWLLLDWRHSLRASIHPNPINLPHFFYCLCQWFEIPDYGWIGINSPKSPFVEASHYGHEKSLSPHSHHPGR